MNFKAILSYDGTRYFGWQKTRMGPSIQEEMANAIFQITGESAMPEAASGLVPQAVAPGRWRLGRQALRS